MKKHSIIAIYCLFASAQLTFQNAKAWMNTSTIIQSKQKIFSTNTNLNESCYISPHFPMGSYSDKDIKREQELCNIDFYNSEQFAICPKLNHTNPAIEVYQLSSNISKKSFERKQCFLDSKARDPETKKIAKFKVSSSSSYFPAPLFAYHLSRILGSILEVPPAVLRTTLSSTYNDQANLALNYLEKNNSQDLIVKTWSVLKNQLNNPNNNSRSPYILSLDFQTAVGALIKNPNNEKDWLELMVGKNNHQTERAQLFMQLPEYRQLTKVEDIKTFVDKQWTNDNIQKVQTLGDVADMLVFDYIMQQEDRFYNIAYTESWVQKSEETTSPKISFISDKEKQQNSLNNDPEIYKIKKMMLKDNDSGIATEKGVSRRNIVDVMNMLGPIKHLKQSTYKKILTLNSMLNSTDSKMHQMSAQFNKLCTEELLMTNQDLRALRSRINTLAIKLKAACQQNILKLDLDLEYHFLKSEKKYSCDLNAK